jgi:transcription-repair coupling factor (superfamily II helicase)
MVAQKRLKAIMEASELGSGLQIAMKDLEIRGAGNLLGAQQSGHMNAIGFELYSQLLSSAVEELKFEKSHIDAENTSMPINADKKHVVVDLAVEAIIPDAYIPDLPTRLGIYQRLVKTLDHESCDGIQSELVDRFGKLPGEVENLIYVTRIKILAREAGVDSIIQEGSDLILKFDAEIGGAQDALQAALGSLGRVGLKQIRVRIGDSLDKILKETLNRLKEFRDRLIILSDPPSLK